MSGGLRGPLLKLAFMSVCDFLLGGVGHKFDHSLSCERAIINTGSSGWRRC